MLHAPTHVSQFYLNSFENVLFTIQFSNLGHGQAHYLILKLAGRKFVDSCAYVETLQGEHRPCVTGTFPKRTFYRADVQQGR